ncbi:hypothetical protein AOLI_G00255740 [Acnodon oligacanthus]
MDSKRGSNLPEHLADTPMKRVNNKREKSAMDQPPPSEDANAGNGLIPGGHPNQSGLCQGQNYEAQPAS